MDLTTTYLGLKLKNPIVPSSGPYSHSIDSMKQLEDSGASAIVLSSLFEEQITHEAAELEHHLSAGSESFAESLSYFPKTDDYKVGPEEYLELVRKSKQSLNIPIIGSLNGMTSGGWINYAKKIEEAGADAIELNVYYIPTDLKITSQNIEARYIEILKMIKQTIKIPVAMKLSPFFSSTANLISRLDDAGVDGLVLFNRFYQPDIDIENLEVKPNLLLSNSHEMRLPLRWIAILYGKIRANLAATTGIRKSEDVIKMLMAGADVTMVCSAILQLGPSVIKNILGDMQKWMEEKDYKSVKQMKGSMSQKSVADPAAFERANYMKVLNSYK